MEIGSIGVGAILVVVGGGIVYAILKGSSLKDMFGPGSRKDNIRVDDVTITDEPVKTNPEKAKSSKKNLRNLGDKLMNIFKLILIIVLFPGVTSGMQAIEIPDDEYEIMKATVLEYRKMTEKYVDLTEKEFDKLRDWEDRKAIWYTRPALAGRYIDVFMKIPVQQPYIDANGNVEMIDAPAIERNARITPKYGGSIFDKKGFNLFTGIMLGAHYDLRQEKMIPAVGFEVVTYYAGPIAFGAFPMIDMSGWGFGVGIGPTRGMNLRSYFSGSKSYDTSDISFNVGIAALVGW